MPDPILLTEITGFPQLIEKIKTLANDKQKKTEILKILRRVAAGTVQVARREAPVSDKPHLVSGKRTRKVIQPGALKKAIGVIQGKRGAAKENPTIYVGPRAKGNNDGWYGNFVEYGHNIYKKGFKRKHSVSGKAKAHNAAGAKRRTKANLFMARTYSQTKGQVTQEAAASVTKYIQKRFDALSR
jgi:HK97 gp10 family phage protein